MIDNIAKPERLTTCAPDLPLAASVRAALCLRVAEGKKAAQGGPLAFNLFTGNRPAPVGRGKRLMPGKRKPPP